MVRRKSSGGDARPGRAVVLVGFQAMGNLGLGYLASSLRQAGFAVRLLDVEAPVEKLVEAIRAADPLLAGFSLIFQFYIRRYAALMRELREAGVRCHFTMGGHYPSLSSRQTLLAIPELDSVVRHEGEVTLVEMARALSEGRNWRGLDGIAYRRGGEVVVNPARALIADLDRLPYPDRSYELPTILGRKLMPILASRGCVRTCSFCSIHSFYRSAPGKVVRLRRPAEVVREMQLLHRTRGVDIFLFQDDNFPMQGKKWRAWTGSFVDELHAAGLAGRVLWKISCRADTLDAELLARMCGAGLFAVYLGLESGNEAGLKMLNKGITVEQNLAAVRLLKRLGIRFQFGFMLLDPSSTFESILGNIAFLRDIVGDGCASATFCKMLPYDGTPIKQALQGSGRLKGDVCTPDYDFLDPRLDAFYAALARILQTTGWVHGSEALSMHLDTAWAEIELIRRFYPPLPGTDAYQAKLRRLTRRSNARLFQAVEQTARHCRTGDGQAPDPAALRRRCELTLKRLLEARNAFIAAHQATLLEAFRRAA